MILAAFIHSTQLPNPSYFFCDTDVSSDVCNGSEHCGIAMAQQRIAITKLMTQ